MKATTSHRIAKLRFSEPRRNLPSYGTGRGEEHLFTYRFAQAYVAQFRALHRPTTRNRVVVAREIPANGYGIADLVAVSWKSAGNGKAQSVAAFVAKGRPIVRAFEIKMRDWRKALRQANRYRFFAHTPIVVLPAASVTQALEHIETFRLLGVGLWSFDMKTNRIIPHFTPRPHHPLDSRQHIQALLSTAKATKALPVS
jgi:hypothetical protein